MGFFKDLKEDFSLAINELMPEKNLFEEDLFLKNERNINTVKSEEESDNIKEEEVIAVTEHSKENKKNTRDRKEILEKEVFAAIEALNGDEEQQKQALPNKAFDKVKNEMDDEEMKEKEINMEADTDTADLELIAQLFGDDATDYEFEADDEFESDESLFTENQERSEDRTQEEESRELLEDITIIAKGTTVNGSISSDGSLEVRGIVNGDIDCLGKLSIAGTVNGNSVASEIYVNTPRLEGNLLSTGRIKVGVGTIVTGDLKATSAVIAGAVRGQIDVNGLVIVDSTAILKGNINSKSVQINNGAVVDGFCSLSYASVDIDNFFDGDK